MPSFIQNNSEKLAQDIFLKRLINFNFSWTKWRFVLCPVDTSYITLTECVLEFCLAGHYINFGQWLLYKSHAKIWNFRSWQKLSDILLVILVCMKWKTHCKPLNLYQSNGTEASKPVQLIYYTGGIMPRQWIVTLLWIVFIKLLHSVLPLVGSPLLKCLSWISKLLLLGIWMNCVSYRTLPQGARWGKILIWGFSVYLVCE